MASNPPRTPTQSAPLGSRVSLPVGNRNVEDLLLWRDVRKSGAVLFGITIVYILLEWSNLSLLRIVSNSLLATVTLSFLWNNAAHILNKPGPPIPAFLNQGLREAEIRNFAERVAFPLNKFLGFVRRVINGQDVVLSIEVAVALYIFGRLGNYFTSLALLYTVVLLAFSVPKAYELKKHEVDQVVSSVQKQSRSYYKQYAAPYVNKIPRASTSTANTGSVTAGNHNNLGDSADSYSSLPKTNLQNELNAAANPTAQKLA